MDSEKDRLSKPPVNANAVNSSTYHPSVLVVISHYNAWSSDQLIALLDQMWSVPAGYPFQARIVANRAEPHDLALPLQVPVCRGPLSPERWVQYSARGSKAGASLRFSTRICFFRRNARSSGPDGFGPSYRRRTSPRRTRGREPQLRAFLGASGAITHTPRLIGSIANSLRNTARRWATTQPIFSLWCSSHGARSSSGSMVSPLATTRSAL